MLIQADARRIPLADKSVQVCITSPPYFGLRSYGLAPSVWGGNPECQHVWEGSEVHEHRELIEHGKTRTTDRFYGDESRRFDGNHQKHSSNVYCVKCGAWSGCLGHEKTPGEYICHLVEIFREVKRVLRDDGILWVIIGDSYAGSNKGIMGDGSIVGGPKQRTNQGSMQGNLPGGFSSAIIKPKDLVGIPWMFAFALRDDGWYLRRDIIWAKGVSFCPTYSGSSMPESVRDRPSSSHEYVFLLSKSKRYFYDNEAVKEPSVYPKDDRKSRANSKRQKRYPTEEMAGIREGSATYPKRNLRSVWTINPASYKAAHYAVFPLALIEPMVLAGTSARGACPICGKPWVRMVEKVTRFEGGCGKAGRTPEEIGGQWGDKRHGKNILLGPVVGTTTIGWQPTCDCYDGMDLGQLEWDIRMGLLEYAPTPCVVLDPFCGSGTTGMVAIKHGREFVGLDLNSDYLHKLAVERLDGIQKVLL